LSQALINVCAFVALLAVLAWALKRLRSRSMALEAAPIQPARVLEMLPLGGRERLLVVELGPSHARCRLVLGVTAHAIHRLHELPVREDETASPLTEVASPLTPPTKPASVWQALHRLLHGVAHG